MLFDHCFELLRGVERDHASCGDGDFLSGLGVAAGTLGLVAELEVAETRELHPVSVLERGESVKLSGFGNFQLRDKPQRPGRNPKTGEEIPISARRVVTFHASQKLKAMVEKARHGAKPQET